MLNAFELRLTALIADRMSQRTHLSVMGSPVPQAAPAAGKGRIVVAVGELTPCNGFRPEVMRERTAPPESKRVLGLQGTVHLVFQMQPASNSATDVADARTLMLEDISLVSHALADDAVSAGTAFDDGTDAGFRVLSFLLNNGNGVSGALPVPLSGELLYSCLAEIWPPVAPQPTGTIGGISTVITPLPLHGTGVEQVVQAGKPVVLRVNSLPKQRPAAAGQPAVPLSLAIKVLSSVPPASRGTISSGAGGAETGVRIVPVTQPETSIIYQAPALASGERVEYVAIHYATPDNKAGVFLGSIAVRTKGGA
jgi:hypothetical protein